MAATGRDAPTVRSSLQWHADDTDEAWKYATESPLERTSGGVTGGAVSLFPSGTAHAVVPWGAPPGDPYLLLRRGDVSALGRLAAASLERTRGLERHAHSGQPVVPRDVHVGPRAGVQHSSLLPAPASSASAVPSKSFWWRKKAPISASASHGASRASASASAASVLVLERGGPAGVRQRLQALQGSVDSVSSYQLQNSTQLLLEHFLFARHLVDDRRIAALLDAAKARASSRCSADVQISPRNADDERKGAVIGTTASVARTVNKEDPLEVGRLCVFVCVRMCVFCVCVSVCMCVCVYVCVVWCVFCVCVCVSLCTCVYMCALCGVCVVCVCVSLCVCVCVCVKSETKGKDTDDAIICRLSIVSLFRYSVYCSRAFLRYFSF